jgi:hypothetical protein
MNHNDPYAKLGGGALDQELFKSKQTPLSAHVSDTSDKIVNRSKAQVAPSSRRESENKESKSIIIDVMTSSLHDVDLRAWRDTIENTETHNS